MTTKIGHVICHIHVENKIWSYNWPLSLMVENLVIWLVVFDFFVLWSYYWSYTRSIGHMIGHVWNVRYWTNNWSYWRFGCIIGHIWPIHIYDQVFHCSALDHLARAFRARGVLRPDIGRSLPASAAGGTPRVPCAISYILYLTHNKVIPNHTKTTATTATTIEIVEVEISSNSSIIISSNSMATSNSSGATWCNNLWVIPLWGTTCGITGTEACDKQGRN